MNDINEIKLKLESMKGFGSITKGEILVLLTTVEQYEMAVTQQQEAFKDQGKEILKYRNELESQKEEIAKLRYQNAEWGAAHETLETQFKSQEAITELAVKDLKMICESSEDSITRAFAKDSISEIERLSNAQT